MSAALAFHEALKTVTYSDLLDREELARLRFFVDDTLTLVETLNDTLPVAEVVSDLYDPNDGLDSIVKRLWISKPRPARR